MNNNNLSYFEARLTKELEAIEERIKELKYEKRALSKQLAKARADRTGLQFTTRKNSMNRVLAENSIIEALRGATQPISTKELYLNALTTNYDLKETTFRSYLHRLKNAGIIKNVKYAGHWGLAEDKEGSS